MNKFNVSVAEDNMTMSSLEIAELTGKEHRNVMRDIRKMFEELDDEDRLLSFEHTVERPNPSGGSPIKSKYFSIPKRETLILVSGYNIKMRAAIIDRWQELEAANMPSYMIEDDEMRARAWLQEKKQLKVAQQQALALQHKILEDEPLTEIGKHFIEQKQDSYSVKQVVQAFSMYMLNDEHKTIGLNTFMDFLRFAKIIGKNNLPYQKYIDKGLLKVHNSLINGMIFQSTHFLNKGIEWMFFKNKATLAQEWENYVKLIERRKRLMVQVKKDLKNNP